MKLRRTAFPMLMLGALIGCNSTTGNKATVSGTWHVTLSPLTSGTLAPATFDVVVPSNGTIVTMPGLTWSVGSQLFDSLPSLTSFGPSDTTDFGFGELTRSPTRPCEAVAVQGTLNAAKDTLLGATVAIYDTATISAVLYCVASVTGSATAHK